MSGEALITLAIQAVIEGDEEGAETVAQAVDGAPSAPVPAIPRRGRGEGVAPFDTVFVLRHR